MELAQTQVSASRSSALCRLAYFVLTLTALTVGQRASAQSPAREILAPKHPNFALELGVGGALAPIGRAWFADVHLELSAPISVGFRGAFVRCEACASVDGDPDDDRSATASTYVAYSQRNYAIGGSFNFALGDELDSSKSVTSFGGGLWLRFGRLDGIRVEIGLSGLGGGGHAAFGFYGTLRVPVYANELLRIWIEGRSEVVLPSPTVVILTGGLRARIGRVLVGVHGLFSPEQPSFLLSIGLRL